MNKDVHSFGKSLPLSLYIMLEGTRRMVPQQPIPVQLDGVMFNRSQHLILHPELGSIETGEMSPVPLGGRVFWVIVAMDNSVGWGLEAPNLPPQDAVYQLVESVEPLRKVCDVTYLIFECEVFPPVLEEDYADCAGFANEPTDTSRYAIMCVWSGIDFMVYTLRLVRGPEHTFACGKWRLMSDPYKWEPLIGLTYASADKCNN